MTEVLNNTINISDAEWEVMRVLWAEAPLTSREIIDRLTSVLEWKEGTIKSLLNRLVQKNSIYKDTSTSPFQFEPAMAELDANYIKANQMMEPVCVKNRGEIIQHLVNTNALTQTQIKALMLQLESKLETAPEELDCRCPVGQCTCHIH